MGFHYKFSASASKRWLKPPASIRLSEGLPPEAPSPYAAEGTMAHEVAECVLNVRIGGTPPYPEGMTQEMAEGARLYADTIAENCEIKKGHVEDKLVVVPELCGGTADFWYEDEDFDFIEVDDYKFGKGVEVFPDEPQTGIYLLGVIRKIGRWPKVCRSRIIQPRLYDPTARVKTHIWSKEALLELESNIRSAIEKASDPSVGPCAGDWCKWCRVKDCSAKAKLMLEHVSPDFDAYSKAPLAPVKTALLAPEKLTKDKRLAILKWRKTIQDWLDDVQLFCDRDAISGEVYEGFHLKPGRATRKWSSEKDAVECLTLAGMKKDQIFKDEIITPAQAEKILGKEKAAEFAPYMDVSHGKPTLVPSKSDFE